MVIDQFSHFRHVTELVLGGNGQEPVVLWHFVRDFLNKHERDRYEQLQHIYTDLGRGRAWLRSSLNEKSLERYVLCILDAVPEHMAMYYEDWAFLRDQELSNVLPQAAAGLASILFAINICREELNQSEADRSVFPEPVIPALAVVSGKFQIHAYLYISTFIIQLQGVSNKSQSSLET